MLGTLGASWAYLAIILGAMIAATSSKQQEKAASSSKQQQIAENRSKQQQTEENIQIGGSKITENQGYRSIHKTGVQIKEIQENQGYRSIFLEGKTRVQINFLGCETAL